MRRSGQAAIEFLILLGFMVLVFTTFFFILGERTAIKNEQVLREELITVAGIVEQEVTMAHRIPGGYARSFELPLKVQDQDYTVELYPPEAPSEIVVRSDEFEYVVFLQVNLTDVSDIAAGYNQITKDDGGNVTINWVEDPAECFTAGECGTPPECQEYECNNPGTAIASCDLTDLDAGDPCEIGDGLVCTDDYCDGAGSCFYEDTCTSPETCQPDSTCQLICPVGEVDVKYYAGVSATSWTTTGTTNRVASGGSQVICCDEQAECPWRTGLGVTSCTIIGQPSVENLFLCEDDDTGIGAELPTYFQCDLLKNGTLLKGSSGREHCCSFTTDGVLEWNSTPQDNKREGLAYGISCSDGSDNDCDGFLDATGPNPDPDCIVMATTYVDLNSTCQGYSTEEDLIANPNIVETYTGLAYNWSVDGVSILGLNMNFDVNDNPASGQTRDYSGHTNHGGLRNGATWQSSTGRAGTGAIFFDGVNRNYIAVPNPTFAAIRNDFTIEAWVNPMGVRATTIEAATGISGTANQRYVIYPAHYGNGGDSGAGLSVGTNGISVFEHASGYLPSLLVYNVALSGWNHVVVVYEGKRPRLYLNGQFIKEGLTSLKANVHPGKNIGGHNVDYGPFHGTIDEVRIYNRVLSSQQILALYNELPTMVNEETVAGETWSVCMTTNDGTQDHPTVCSNDLTVNSNAYACSMCTFADTGVRNFAGPSGVTWSMTGTTDRHEISPVNICCDETAYCPWQKSTGPDCVAVGQKINRIWWCEDDNTGTGQSLPTAFKCDASKDGDILEGDASAMYCCSIRSSGTGQGLYAFNASPTNRKAESLGTGCFDGSDNDCDGFVDCWDSDCLDQCIMKKPVPGATASNSLPSNPPQSAVDGNTGTYWNSGRFRPQWIRLDLGRVTAVSKLRMKVAQFPAGLTIHEINASVDTGPGVLVDTLSGETSSGQWLDSVFPEGQYRYITVRTTQSPSWVAWQAIEIWGLPECFDDTDCSFPTPVCDIACGNPYCASSSSC